MIHTLTLVPSIVIAAMQKRTFTTLLSSELGSNSGPTLQLAEQPAGRWARDQGADGTQRRQLVEDFKAVLWGLVAGVPGRRLRLE